MKRIILFTFTILGITSFSFGQVSLSKDTAYINMEQGVSHKDTIVITNNSGHDVELRWSLISSNLKDYDAANPNDHWSLQFCECITCYTNDFSTLPTGAQCAAPLGFAPGANKQYWYLTINPNQQPMYNGKWVIKLDNLTDGITDTLVYLAVDPDGHPNPNPNSIKETSYNADVTSYPNPAKNQLTIEYSLTNVNTPVLSVYNLIGSKVASHSLNSVNGTFDINTSNLENGMYFYTIEEKGQRVFIQKFNVVH